MIKLFSKTIHSKKESAYTLIQHILSTLAAARDHTLRGPVLWDHRGDQLSKLPQRTAVCAAWQREGIWLVLSLVSIVHLYKVLSGGGRQKRELCQFCVVELSLNFSPLGLEHIGWGISGRIYGNKQSLAKLGVGIRRLDRWARSRGWKWEGWFVRWSGA